MVEIEPEDWIHLPDVPAGRDSVNIDTSTEEWLAKADRMRAKLGLRGLTEAQLRAEKRRGRP